MTLPLSRDERHRTSMQPIIAPPPLPTPKFGPSRWASPRRYSCAHAGCSGAASTLARVGAHEVAPGDSKTHNCCGSHDPRTEKDT